MTIQYKDSPTLRWNLCDTLKLPVSFLWESWRNSQLNWFELKDFAKIHDHRATLNSSVSSTSCPSTLLTQLSTGSNPRILLKYMTTMLPWTHLWAPPPAPARCWRSYPRVRSPELPLLLRPSSLPPSGLRIRINLSCWIRIRIQIADPDPGGQKWPTKIEKRTELFWSAGCSLLRAEQLLL